jgi:hypothetical protein
MSVEGLITPDNANYKQLKAARAYLNSGIPSDTKGGKNLSAIFVHAEMGYSRGIAETNRGCSIGDVDELRLCNPQNARTGIDDPLLVDPFIASTFGKSEVPEVCFNHCPLGSMYHAGVHRDGKRRIVCDKHSENLRLLLNSVNRDDLFDALVENKQRFMRSPDLSYLAKALGVVKEYFEEYNLFRYLIELIGNLDPEYEYGAISSTCHLYTNLPRALDDIDTFRECIEEFGSLGAHNSRVKSIRTSNEHVRKIDVPRAIVEPIRNLVATRNTSNLSEAASDFGSKVDINEVIGIVFEGTKGVFDSVNPQSDRLDNAMMILYTMEKSWVWFNGNHSRCMQYFNVLLEEIGIDPIPHGFVDFAAHSLDFNDFKLYMKYLLSELS